MAQTQTDHQLTISAIGFATVLALGSGAWGQPLRGSPDLEPGLEGRDDILLFEDFEQDDWEDHFTGIGHDENLSIVDEPAFMGAHALEVRAPDGEHDGASLSFRFADIGLEEPEEVYFRYYVRIDDSWSWPGESRTSSGEIGKFPGFAGTYGVAGWGDRRSDGYNGWSARMMNFDEGDRARLGFYTYHIDQTASHGTHLPWEATIERNEWVCVEAYIRLNTLEEVEAYTHEDHRDLGEITTLANSDGVLRGWIDDEPVFERTDLRWRHIPTLRIERVWANIYVGGSWVAEQDMRLHLDNIVIARDRIGCYSESSLEEETDAGADAGPGPDAGPGSDADVETEIDEGGDGGAETGPDAGDGSGSDSGPGGNGDIECECDAGPGSDRNTTADGGDEATVACSTDNLSGGCSFIQSLGATSSSEISLLLAVVLGMFS